MPLKKNQRSFRAQIVDNALTRKRTGTLSINVKLQLKYDTFDDTRPLPVVNGKEQSTVYADMWITRDAVQNTIKTLRSLGVEPVFDKIDGQLAEKWCDVVVEKQHYQGKDRLKVVFVNPPGGGGIQRLDEQDKSAAASEAQNIAADAQSISDGEDAAPPADAWEEAEAESNGDDDLPF